MREERKLVTVIFADIVGSTALGTAHDPEIIRSTFGRTFRALSEILQAHGGTVEKFIGDAIMAVFGIPSAHDDDAERAVRAAFALRDRLAAMNQSGGPQLEIRVGVNSGEAVTGLGQEGQHLVTGPVVNIAARLQSSAVPGEILVGELTRRLTRGGVRYGETKVANAKGIGPVEAWPAEELLSALPEQHHGISGLHAPLVGRDRELRRLLEEYAQLQGSNAARLVTVYGPAGSGKSRLTSEFIGAIGGDRARTGRCLPYGEGITYYAVQVMVRADAGIQPHDDLQTATAKLRAATLAAFPGAIEDADAVSRRVAVLAGLVRAEDELPDIAPADLREELRWGLRRYFERRAGASPLVLVFEDIHWAEPGLLDVIGHLAEWSRAPLLLLCLARPEFRESSPTWGSSAANVTTMMLSPLSGDETRRLIAELLPSDALPESVRSQLVSRAEGNPLFVEEFLRMLMETGRIDEREGTWIGGEGLVLAEMPPTLLGLITARLDRVTPDLKFLLQRGSLPGRLFSTAALAALGRGVEPAPALLREAVRRDLLVESDERALGPGRVFRFKHVFIRDVAYSMVSKAERSQLHDRYGRWLAETFGDRRNEVAEIIAYHAEQAYLFARELGTSELSDLGQRALDLLSLAASKALDRDDPHAALNLYERTEAVATAIAAAASQTAEAHGYVVILRRQIAVEQRSLGELDDAITMARAGGPSRVLVDLLMARGFESHRFGGSGMPFALEALAFAQATADPELVAEAMWAQLELVFFDGDLDAMQRVLTEALAYLKATGARRARGRILFWGSRLARNRGDLTQSAIFRDELASTRSGSRVDRAITALTDCRLAIGAGDLDAAVGEGQDALALMREVGLPHWIGLCCLHLGDALLMAGDAAGAKDLLQEGLDIFVRRRQSRQIPELAARAARASVRLGDIAAAREYADTARATSLVTDPESRYISALAIADLREAEGDLAGADAGFREALTILEPTGFLSARAFVRETYGEFLLRHGRVAEARTELHAAREFHQDPLAFRNRERIDALLARAQISALRRI